VAAQAFGPSPASRPASVCGPRALLITTSYPYPIAARASRHALRRARAGRRVAIVEIVGRYDLVEILWAAVGVAVEEFMQVVPNECQDW
jgi:hypothetical protein